MPHAIDYVEFSVRDLPEAQRFFAAALGWSFTDYGPTYASFSSAEAGIDGGFEQVDAPPSPGGRVLVVLYASDLEATQAKIEAAGGRITKPTYAFPGGRRFHFSGPDGNEMAVWSE